MKSSLVSITLLLLLILTLLKDSNALCECNKEKCKEAKGCRAGIRADSCNCCMICAKDEGEVCGGENQAEGYCGDNLQCVVRKRRAGRNLSVDELVGRCEFVQCHFKGCPFGQTCTLIDNKPTCVCPRCKDMKNVPVCGKENQKQYKNECELRTEECLTGKDIGMKEGLCEEQSLIKVGCYDNWMRIEVSKSYLAEAEEQKYHFSLLDDSCKMHENKTHIYTTLLMTECKTKILNSSKSIYYSNVVRTPTHLSQNEYENVYIPFECKYTKQPLNSSKKLRNPIDDTIHSNGVDIGIATNVVKRRRKYRSINSRIKVDVDYLEKYLVVMQAKALAKYNALLSPTFCYASPIEKSQQWMKYFFIRRGCPIEDGVAILKTESPFVKMTVPSIKFRTARYSGILIRCRIRACFPKTPNDTPLCETICPFSGHRRMRNRRDLDKNILIEYESTESMIYLS